MARTWRAALCAGAERILRIRRVESDAVARANSIADADASTTTDLDLAILAAQAAADTVAHATADAARPRPRARLACVARAAAHAPCQRRRDASALVPGPSEFTGQSADARVVLTRGREAADRYRQPVAGADHRHRRPVSVADHRDADHSISVGIADHRKSDENADAGTDTIAHDFCETDLCSQPGAVSGAIDLSMAEPAPDTLAEPAPVDCPDTLAERSSNTRAVAQSDDSYADVGADAG